MLKNRSHITEKMDNLHLDGPELEQTLNGLSVINALLGNTSATFKAIRKELKKHPNETIRIIDLGCGGGDNLRRISKWCYQNNRPVNLIGIDGNANILTYAKAKNNAQTKITYLQADILHPSFELDHCDILISSHFMYHFTDDALVTFLKKAKSKVTNMIVFSDLYRSPTAYQLFKIFGFLMPFHPTVKQDGLTAITRSFKKKELRLIAEKAGLTDYSIQYKWIFRYLLLLKM